MLKKLFWLPFSNTEKIESYQQRIRDLEWSSYVNYIPKESRFLDVGCGAGYNIERAKLELGCDVIGVDPAPGEHGVGRFSKGIIEERSIIQGFAEKLPFESNTFDVVFSSHVLEHVNDIDASLEEMKRVLKPGGVLIIGMPTATMCLIALFSHYFFTTHVNFLFFLKSLLTFNKDVFDRLLRILLPNSHSYPNARFIIFDLFHYRISNWRKKIKSHWKIEEELLPVLYPYPDYIQWFPMLNSKKFSSSVFFICRK